MTQDRPPQTQDLVIMRGTAFRMQPVPFENHTAAAPEDARGQGRAGSGCWVAIGPGRGNGSAWQGAFTRRSTVTISCRSFGSSCRSKQPCLTLNVTTSLQTKAAACKVTSHSVTCLASGVLDNARPYSCSRRGSPQDNSSLSTTSIPHTEQVLPR